MPAVWISFEMEGTHMKVSSKKKVYGVIAINILFFENFIFEATKIKQF